MSFTEGSGKCRVSGACASRGPCPSEGLHSADGSIFVGSYDSEKWQSELVKLNHKEIREKRAERRTQDLLSTSFRGNDRSIKALKRNKR